METQFYLLFSLHGSRYGINTSQVREIVLLPELTPTIAVGAAIVGVINLRERIVPILDLDLHFGHQPSAYQLNDRVIFLERDDKLLGIIVNEVDAVEPIRSACIDITLAHEAVSGQRVPLTIGIASIDDDLVTLLNAENLFQLGALPTLSQEEAPEDHLSPTFSSLQPIPSLPTSLEEQAILRDRARNLMQRTETQELDGLLSFAVLKLGSEYFGIETAVMREFTEINQVTPIPCCPNHILGNINLRGEIVTLLSLHHKLNVSPSGTKKAVVITVGDTIAGITVDDVLDVTYVHPSTIKPLPTAAYAESQDFTKGTAAFGKQTMTLLDLPRLLTQGELVVNEYV